MKLIFLNKKAYVNEVQIIVIIKNTKNNETSKLLSYQLNSCCEFCTICVKTLINKITNKTSEIIIHAPVVAPSLMKVFALNE